MDLNVFILFLKCIDGIGDSSIRKLILNNKFSNIDFKKMKEVIEWLKENKKFFSSKFDPNKLTIEDMEKAKNKRRKIMLELENSESKFISWFDDDYPYRFKKMAQTNDFPVLLFYKGDIKLLNCDKTCAMIGTREPSEDTLKIGNAIGNKMVEKGYVIISGLAEGCDTLGHVSCIEAGGKTVAIMGTGIDVIYPKSNVELAHKIVETNGLLVTEEMPGFKGAAYSFVTRDRLQASSADYVIALETAINGGTMHASKDAQKYHNKLITLAPEMIPCGKTSGNVELINFFGAYKLVNVNDLDSILG